MPLRLLAVLLITLFAGCDAASPPTETPAPTEIQRKTGEGELCLVCGMRVEGKPVVELRYKGRRFFVAEEMLDELFADPDPYFRRLQAHSALFDESSYPDTVSWSGWLVFGSYVLAGLVCAALCGHLAITRSLPPLPWFFAGLFGNAAALLVLFLSTKRGAAVGPAGVPAGLAKVAVTHTPVSCSACGRTNHPAARACSHCQAELSPTVRSEVRPRQGGTS